MIEVKGLCKSFGNLVAVDGISFDVPEGQVLGFLGPNGAGKSTTMKMLTCFLPPSGGTAIVNGCDINRDPIGVRRAIGYLPESAPAYGEMTVREFLAFVGEMRGLTGRKLTDAIDRVLELCFLNGVLHQSIDTLSKGYRHRVGFAQALIHDPPVLVLDEPTDGLDPNQKHEVRSLIRSMGTSKTIILSTHILEEVEAVCSRVVIIARGRMVANATPGELVERSRIHNSILLRLAGGVDLRKACAELRAVVGVERVEEETSLQSVRVYPASGAVPLDAVLGLARQQAWRVEDVRVERGRLDEVFRKLTTDAK